METKHIKISDYNYELPDERIAKFPIAQRDHSKLLVYKHGEVSDDVFYHLPEYLPKGAMMVFNNTKVIQARMHFRKETGESPQQYSRRIRVEAACRYLRYSDKTIDEIAELTGFPDRYYFSRVFRQLQHYPPAEYRRAQ